MKSDTECWNISLHTGGGEQGDRFGEGGAEVMGADSTVEARRVTPPRRSHSQGTQGPHRRVSRQGDCQTS